MTRERGFTLIELFVTVAVLAILVAWAVPSFTKLMEKRRLIGAAEIVFEELVRARTEAVKRSKPILVAFHADGTSWAVGITDDLETACDANSTPCMLDYDNDPDTSDSVLMQVTNGDLSIVTIEPLFDDPTPVGCPALESFQTCFEPVRGLARDGSVVVMTDNYAMGVYVTPLGMVRICTESEDGDNAEKKVSGYDPCPGWVFE